MQEALVRQADEGFAKTVGGGWGRTSVHPVQEPGALPR